MTGYLTKYGTRDGGRHILGDSITFTRVFSTPINVSNNTTLELFGTTTLRDADRTSPLPSGYSISGARGLMNPTITDATSVLRFPTPPNPLQRCDLQFRVTVDVNTGSDQNLLLVLRRAVDPVTSPLAEFPIRRTGDTGRNTFDVSSFVRGATDPFVTGGVKFTMVNNSGATITVNGTMSVRAQWSHSMLPSS